MDRRTFIGAVAGGLVTAPLIGRAQTVATVTRPPATEAILRIRGAWPPPNLINFTAGVPARVSVAALLPAGADRYHGDFYYQVPGVYSSDSHLPGVSFDSATLEMVYDGSPPSANPRAVNPNGDYFIGSEAGPYHPHWSFPPISTQAPQPSGNPLTVRSVMTYPYGGKHTRPRYCPYDGLMYIFGGDYASWGLQDNEGQNGRSLMWKVDPVANAWSLAYPAKGRVGEDMPLSPDIMGFSWDTDRQIWWITYGDVRGGYDSNSAGPHSFQANGGLATAWPLVETTPQLDAPVFVFDPKLAQPKYRKLPIVLPWDTTLHKSMESAYDRASKRLYKMAQGTYGPLLHWLDTSNYETDPAKMTFQSKDIDLRVGSSDNLTGTGIHATITGQFESPMHIDESTRRLFFIDSRNPAILALTLPGHPEGEHKVRLVADLGARMVDLSTAPNTLLACASMPFIWVDEHRCLVLMAEPLWQQVGPQSVSLTIDVDTGAVTPGPRFPPRPDGRPYFAGAGCWFPPTQEIIVYHCYIGTDAPFSFPSHYHRYAWVP